MEGIKLGRLKTMVNHLRRKRKEKSSQPTESMHPRLMDTSYGVHYYKELENEFSDDMYSNFYEGSRANMGISNASFEEMNAKNKRDFDKSNDQQTTNHKI